MRWATQPARSVHDKVEPRNLTDSRTIRCGGQSEKDENEKGERKKMRTDKGEISTIKLIDALSTPAYIVHNSLWPTSSLVNFQYIYIT